MVSTFDEDRLDLRGALEADLKKMTPKQRGDVAQVWSVLLNLSAVAANTDTNARIAINLLCDRIEKLELALVEAGILEATSSRGMALN